MNTASKPNDSLFAAVSPYPTTGLVLEMVHAAEKELEQELDDKRHRLRTKIDCEIHEFQRELLDKDALLHDHEIDLRRESLRNSQIKRKLERQKYVEMKQLQQHLQNSEEVRLESSKRFMEECVAARMKQIEEKKREESMLREFEQLIVREALLKQQEEDRQKEVEAERIRMMKKLEMKQMLQQQSASKLKARKEEQEMERKLLEQSYVVSNQIEEGKKRAKQREIENHKAFLQYQIVQRKEEEDSKRKQRLEYEKATAELAKQEIEREAMKKALAKKQQYVESVQFLEHMNRLCSERQNTEAVEFDLKQTSLINEDIDAAADVERLKKKRSLQEEKRGEYFKQFHEKREERLKQKQQDVVEFMETEKQNSEYERMMAIMKTDNQMRVQHDLRNQMDLKEKELARKREEEIASNRQMEEIEKTKNAITQKLLASGVDGLSKEHPFYSCLKSRDGHTRKDL